jgi:YgiT-type zinc finger domain-containing protein
MTDNEVGKFRGGKIEHRRMRVQSHLKGDTIYVDGVPAWVCARCGEQYFAAPVYNWTLGVVVAGAVIELLLCHQVK